MGAYVSKDTRRISFDNTFELISPIPLQKSIEAENSIAFDNLPPEPSDELLFKDSADFQEDGEMEYWSHRIDYLKKEHQIMKCYEENAHQPLVCSALVQAFTNCVTNCRLED
ncbi:hypothetical protein HF086_014843 [Spodoptera exigua]|uniref:Uncharacterized protein n=1 Tax=Spodoptera exigua TaxID=7107 RepID=A0A922SGX5_SPOEX|nr:hypothetical protein HF086_014843 [Spodoptera exigua]